MLRSLFKGVAKNTSIMLFQQMITWGSSFLLILFLPRYLGPVDYGTLFLAWSLSDMFRVLVSYGGNYQIAKTVSRSPDQTGQIFSDAVSIRMIIGVIALVLMASLSLLLGYNRDVLMVIMIYAAGLLTEAGITSYYACYQGRELLQYTSGAAIVQRVFISVAAVVAILLGAGVLVVAVIVNLGYFLQVGVLARYSRIIMPNRPSVNWQRARVQLREGVPYLLFTIFSTIYYRIDSVMLSRLAPQSVVGWYGGAYRLFDTFNFLPYIFTVAVYPVLSRLWTSEENTHRRATQKSLEFIIIAGVPISIGVIGFSENVIRLFYGAETYDPAILVLQILTIGLLVLYVDMVLGTTLLSSDKQRQQAVVALCAIPLNIGLNFLLIPYYEASAGNGGIGAAIATVVTECLIMMSMLYLLPRGILRGFRYTVVAKSLMSGACMAGWITAGKIIGLPWPVVALVCPVVYGTMIAALRTFEPAEAAFLRSLAAVRDMAGLKRLLNTGHV